MAHDTETAVFAGGCFWGVQDLFRRLDGVVATKVGYTGGDLDNPVYNDVKTGRTGHAEAVHLTFDPSKISYREILEFLFQIHDPTTKDRQGNDVGSQYRSAIFFGSPEQEKTAREVIAEVDASGKWPGKVVTEVVPAQTFYDAEEVHQDYLVKYPNGYTCHFVRPDWTLAKKSA